MHKQEQPFLNIQIQPPSQHLPKFQPEIQYIQQNKDHEHLLYLKPYEVVHKWDGNNNNFAKMNKIYEDILPSGFNISIHTFNTLNERINISDYIRSLFVNNFDGEEIIIPTNPYIKNKKLSQLNPNIINLMSRMKFMDINPYHVQTLNENPSDTLTPNFCLFNSCYPITNNKSNIECAKQNLKVNIRVYKLTLFDLFVEKIGFSEVSHLWNQIDYYNMINLDILKKKISPNFVCMYTYYRIKNIGISFPKKENDKTTYIQNIAFILIVNHIYSKYIIFDLKQEDYYTDFLKNHDLNQIINGYTDYLNNTLRPYIDTLNNYAEIYNDTELKFTYYKDNYYNKMDKTDYKENDIDCLITCEDVKNNKNNNDDNNIVILTEAPTQNILNWMCNMYEMDKQKNMKLIQNGFHSDQEWESIIFQLLYAVIVMFKTKIMFDPFTLKNNVFIKQTSNTTQNTGVWNYIIDNLTFSVPNHGNMILIDTNYKENIYKKEYFNAYNFIKQVQTNIFNFTNFNLNNTTTQKCIKPSNKIENLIRYINNNLNSIILSMDQNYSNMKNNFIVFLQTFLNPPNNISEQIYPQNLYNNILLPSEEITNLHNILKTELNVHLNSIIQNVQISVINFTNTTYTQDLRDLIFGNNVYVNFINSLKMSVENNPYYQTLQTINNYIVNMENRIEQQINQLDNVDINSIKQLLHESQNINLELILILINLIQNNNPALNYYEIITLLIKNELQDLQGQGITNLQELFDVCSPIINNKIQLFQQHLNAGNQLNRTETIELHLLNQINSFQKFEIEFQKLQRINNIIVLCLVLDNNNIQYFENICNYSLAIFQLKLNKKELETINTIKDKLIDNFNQIFKQKIQQFINQHNNKHLNELYNVVNNIVKQGYFNFMHNRIGTMLTDVENRNKIINHNDNIKKGQFISCRLYGLQNDFCCIVSKVEDVINQPNYLNINQPRQKRFTILYYDQDNVIKESEKLGNEISLIYDSLEMNFVQGQKQNVLDTYSI